MLGVWPAALTAGVAFAIPQFLISNLHGPALVDIVASLCSLAALVTLLKRWRPKEIWKEPGDAANTPVNHPPTHTRKEIVQAWTPWVLLSVLIFLWGLPQIKQTLNSISMPQLPVPNLHNVVLRAPPVAPAGAPPEKAIFVLNWLSATGSGILVAAILAGLVMGF